MSNVFYIFIIALALKMSNIFYILFKFCDLTSLCEDCLADYEDEEGYLIKITNSPRMGVGENNV